MIRVPGSAPGSAPGRSSRAPVPLQGAPDGMERRSRPRERPGAHLDASRWACPWNMNPVFGASGRARGTRRSRPGARREIGAPGPFQSRSRSAPGAGSGLHLSGAPLHTVGTATWSSDRETGRALPDDGSRPGAAAGSGDYLAEQRARACRCEDRAVKRVVRRAALAAAGAGAHALRRLEFLLAARSISWAAAISTQQATAARWRPPRALRLG